jgi:glycyl-tRNA synthetase beta chain
VFAAVAALGVTNPLDVHKRVQAVQAFKKLSAAEALSVANKRVSNILAKYEEKIAANGIDPDLFESDEERVLAKRLEEESRLAAGFSETRNYEGMLLHLAELRQPVDNFFDHVLVMAENKPLRENRLLLLGKLRTLFLQVADIALLQ